MRSSRFFESRLAPAAVASALVVAVYVFASSPPGLDSGNALSPPPAATTTTSAWRREQAARLDRIDRTCARMRRQGVRWRRHLDQFVLSAPPPPKTNSTDADGTNEAPPSSPQSPLAELEATKKVAYCHVPKAASSWWLSVLARTMGGSRDKVRSMARKQVLHKLVLPFAVPSSELPDSALKMVFVRNPLRRLTSTYLNKFLSNAEAAEKVLAAAATSTAPPPPPLLDRLRGLGPPPGGGRPEPPRGREDLQFVLDLKEYLENKGREPLVTFPNMVDFVIDDLKNEEESYGTLHWLPNYRLCGFCDIRLDVLGKVETLSDDAANMALDLLGSGGVGDIVVDVDGGGTPASLYSAILEASGERLNSAAASSSASSSEHFRLMSELSAAQMRELCLIYRWDMDMFDYSCDG